MLHLEDKAWSWLFLRLFLLQLALQLDVQVLLLYVLLVQRLHLLGQSLHLLRVGVLGLCKVLDTELEQLRDLVQLAAELGSC